MSVFDLYFPFVVPGNEELLPTAQHPGLFSLKRIGLPISGDHLDDNCATTFLSELTIRHCLVGEKNVLVPEGV